MSRPKSPASASAAPWHVALFVLTAALYAANLGDSFLGDDFDLIGSFFGQPLSYFASLLYSNESGLAWQEYGIDPALGRGYLRPVKMWLLGLDFALWGTSATGYHLTSTLCFAGNALCVLAILDRLMPGRRPLAFAGALGTALHPVFAEVVPFVTAREEILSSLFGLASILALLRARDDLAGGLRFALWFGLALLTKESSIVFLALAGAGDLVRGLRAPPRLARRYAPAAGVLVVYFALRFAAFGNFVGGDGSAVDFGPAHVARYHRTFFASLGDPTLLSLGRLPGGAWLAALPFLALLAAVLARASRIEGPRRAELWLFGPIWYLVSTSLYTGVYFATRHHVVPILGLGICATLCLATLLDQGVLTRPRAACAAWLALAALLFLPPSLTTSLDYRQAAGSVRSIREAIEARTADLPDGCSVHVPDAPQLELPPFYFGWGFLAALRRPFSDSDLARRCQVVNARNRELTRSKRPMPDHFDRVIRLDPAEAIPRPIWRRYQERWARDMGAALPSR